MWPEASTDSAGESLSTPVQATGSKVGGMALVAYVRSLLTRFDTLPLAAAFSSLAYAQ